MKWSVQSVGGLAAKATRDARVQDGAITKDSIPTKRPLSQEGCKHRAVQSRVTRQQRHQNHGPQPQAQSCSWSITRRRHEHTQATKDYTGECASIVVLETRLDWGGREAVSSRGLAARLLHFPKHRDVGQPLRRSATVKNANAWTLPELTQSYQEHETPQTTTKIGLQFIDHLKSAKDKT